jgi:hypothetical protein
MEGKFENLLNVFPNLNTEEQAEVQGRLAKVIEAAKQNALEGKQTSLTEAFFNLLEAARRKQLDTEIEALRATDDGQRFRAQLLLMILSSFHNGMQYQLGLEKVATNASPKNN